MPSAGKPRRLKAVRRGFRCLELPDFLEVKVFDSESARDQVAPMARRGDRSKTDNRSGNQVAV